MVKILVPPIKCQGIKTKLVPLILANAIVPQDGTWIEPFMGSGVVGINARPTKALFSDINPHLITFYNAIKDKIITPEIARSFLKHEGENLRKIGEAHYYDIRERFNRDKNPLDFLFLSRSCFNGLMRFNKKGGFNVPFCRKPERFASAYITKIVNQIARVSELLHFRDWTFKHIDFEDAIMSSSESDFIYCDPPYIGRHVDYFDSWDASDEERLYRSLSKTKAKFILSTWHSNKYRKNTYLKSLWASFHIITKEHFYHVGAKEDNRSSMLEALVMNFPPKHLQVKSSPTTLAPLFDLLPRAETMVTTE